MEIQRSREDFIQEHFQKYPSEKMPPSWKALEIVTFGTLSKLFYDLKGSSVKRQISMDFHERTEKPENLCTNMRIAVFAQRHTSEQHIRFRLKGPACPLPQC